MAERLNDLTGKEWLQNSFSIWRDISKTTYERKMNHPASFPSELAERIIKIWTKKGASVLDPFLGSGSTMVAALKNDRNCVGIELSKEFCDLSKKRIKDEGLVSSNYNIINGDSLLEISKLDKKFDLTVTSPPYWNILNMKRSADKKKEENYSTNINDLGNIESYHMFLKKIEYIFKEVREKTKDSGYCIINVMDIRKKDKFYPFHIDIINAMQNSGWTLDDIIIWDRQKDYNNMRPLGYPYKYRINKVHEYILIFSNKVCRGSENN